MKRQQWRMHEAPGHMLFSACVETLNMHNQQAAAVHAHDALLRQLCLARITSDVFPHVHSTSLLCSPFVHEHDVIKQAHHFRRRLQQGDQQRALQCAHRLLEEADDAVKRGGVQACRIMHTQDSATAYA